MHIVGTMQDEVNEANTDDDPYDLSPHSADQKHVTVDITNIISRYQDITPLGCGANGIIFSATDQICHQRIAVKKVRCALLLWRGSF